MSVLLALLTGILTLLCFPRFGWWPLVFVAQAPLMVALKGLRPGQRFLHGWLSGAVLTAGMQYWIANTLMDMSAFPVWMAGLGLLIYAAYSGLQWGIFAWLYGGLRRWSGHRGWLFTVPLSYILLEKLFPSLFPFTLANALFEVPVLLQVAEFTGASGPSLLIMLIACVLVQSYEDIVRKRYTEHLLMTAGAAIWLVAAVWGVVAMRGVWNAPIRGTPTIALIQPNVTIEEKKLGSSKVGAAIYERTAALTRDALRLRPDLVIWPEGGFPFRFTRMNEPGFSTRNRNHRYSQKLYRMALDMGVDLMIGSLRSQGGHVFNSAIHFPQAGGRVKVYDKQMLVPFGEYLPGGSWTEQWRGKIKGMGNMTPGDKAVSFEALGFTWNPEICYETMLPNLTRNGLNQGNADLLINLTNDVWFGDTAAAQQHLMLHVQRAIENRVWLVRATNSGISAFVDPSGTIRSQTQIGQSTTMTAEIAIPALKVSLYRRFGDWWLWLVSLITAIVIIFRNRNHLRNKLSPPPVARDRPVEGSSS